LKEEEEEGDEKKKKKKKKDVPFLCIQNRVLSFLLLQ
jgi:hypothetical protein